MDTDPQGKKLQRALVLNEPLQEYMNATFKAEKKRTEYVNLVAATLPDSTEEPNAVAEARVEAAKANLAIISGVRATREEAQAPKAWRPKPRLWPRAPRPRARACQHLRLRA